MESCFLLAMTHYLVQNSLHERQLGGDPQEGQFKEGRTGGHCGEDLIVGRQIHEHNDQQGQKELADQGIVQNNILTVSGLTKYDGFLLLAKKC